MNEFFDLCLHVESLTAYAEAAGTIGELFFNEKEDPETKDFYIAWRQLFEEEKEINKYKYMRTDYPELIRSSDAPGSEMIRVAQGESAVRDAVDILGPTLPDTNGTSPQPYSPKWKSLLNIYKFPEYGMVRFSRKRITELLERMDETFGLFEILKRKNQEVRILLPEDADIFENGSSVITRDNDGMLKCGIFLTYHKDKSNDAYFGNDYALLFGICALLLRMAIGADNYFRQMPLDYLPYMMSFFGEDALTLSDEETDELLLHIMCEGMVIKMDLEGVKVPHANDPDMKFAAVKLFDEIIAII